jgi:hypothetical protein
MGVQGSLRTMGLSDILQWLAHGRKTGTLLLEHRSIRKRLILRKGSIFSSWSNDPRESLGQFLIREQLITEENLFRALLEQETLGRPLGAILVEKGHLTEADLLRTLRIKAEETIYDLFLWPDGKFEFREEELAADGPVFHLDLGIQKVLLEGAQRVDEWGRIRKIIPTSRTTFRVLTPPDTGDSAMATKALLLAARNKPLAEIALELRCSNFDAASLLRELLASRRLEVAEVGEDQGPLDAVEKIAQRLALGNRRLMEKRYDAALEAYEDVLAIDRLNQDAKKGLVAVAEARERERAARRIPPQKVPRLVATIKDLARVSLDAQEGFVVSRVNGQWDVRSILKVCPMGEQEALLIFARLLDRKLIELI